MNFPRTWKYVASALDIDCDPEYHRDEHCASLITRTAKAGVSWLHAWASEFEAPGADCPQSGRILRNIADAVWQAVKETY